MKWRTTMEQPLTTSGAAKVLNRCEATVRNYARTGRLRSTRTPSGIRIFDGQDVRRLRAELQDRWVDVLGGSTEPER